MAQAQLRLSDLESKRALSAQFEPQAEKVKQFCGLIRDRLDQLEFKLRREVPGDAQAELTLQKDGNLPMLLVLPAATQDYRQVYPYHATCIGMCVPTSRYRRARRNSSSGMTRTLAERPWASVPAVASVPRPASCSLLAHSICP